VELTAHALRYFVAVAEEEHFGRAAARLHLAPPSLSEQIARLEKQLRVELFERGPRGATLTDAGRDLLPLARSVVAAHDAVADWAVTRRDAVTGTVSVGAFAASAAPVRGRVLAAVEEAHPGLRVVTRRMPLAALVADLRAGGADVGYVPELALPQLTGLTGVPIARHRRVLVVPAGHPLAGRQEASIEETNRDVFVTLADATPEGDLRWLVDPRADGSSPARGPVAADVDELLDLVAAGKGVSIVAEPATDHYTRPGLAFVRLSDVEDARFLLVWRKDERDPAVLAYLAVARRVVGAASDNRQTSLPWATTVEA
jgi:DNA-binding transcriptional LysR family regulator